MIEFQMPSLGADMDAGTLVEWYKRPGDPVKRGDVIALVETQKGAIEIEVFNDGLLGEIRVGAGQKVPVGSVLATILQPGEKPADKPDREVQRAEKPSAPPVKEPVKPSPPPASATAPSQVPAPGERLKITPAARRRAAEAGLDLGAVPPGPHGVIGLREVEGKPARPSAGARPGVDLSEMRKAIAAAMTRSHREIPHYWVGQTIDVTPLFAWLETENAKRTMAARLLYAAPLIKAVALALKAAPELNGHYTENVFRPAEAVHLGIGTALRGGGLVAPALHDVDKADLDTLMASLAELVPRARAGRFRSSEVTDATATFSNLGEGTSDMLLPLIYPPQVAIVGCGGAAVRPWVVEGALVPRRLLQITIAGDHRVSDGRTASRFLSRLDQLLQKPEEL